MKRSHGGPDDYEYVRPHKQARQENDPNEPLEATMLFTLSELVSDLTQLVVDLESTKEPKNQEDAEGTVVKNSDSANGNETQITLAKLLYVFLSTRPLGTFDLDAFFETICCYFVTSEELVEQQQIKLIDALIKPLSVLKNG